MSDFIRREAEDLKQIGIMMEKLTKSLLKNEEITIYVRRWEEFYLFVKRKRNQLAVEIL